MITITRESILAEFDFNPMTGELVRKQSKHGRKPPKQTKSPNRQAFYHQVRINGRKIQAHRIVWFLTHGGWPKCMIDHINGIKDDNRPENLRLAKNAENSWNAKLSKSSASKIKGVQQLKSTGRWQARTSLNGKRIFVGAFKTKEEAQAAIMAKRTQLHGEFVKHE